jgi:peptidoglycan hydrolase-like protein with peptidoglycan-binding domain
MKKIIALLALLSLLLIPLFSAKAIVTIIWSRGQKGDEIKNLQEILREDPNIYPEGQVTGYFGSLTEKAIKKIQARCGLPETGQLDEATEKCIYPIDYQIKVVSPNGGENWDRNQIQTIKWEVVAPTTTILRYPFWQKASIDLFKRVSVTPVSASTSTTSTVTKSVFVKHIATVDLFDQSYSWRISNKIPNGESYVIRITLGKTIVPLWAKEKEKKGEEVEINPNDVWPVPQMRGLVWDESDNVFQISGTAITCPECPPCPKDGKDYSEVIKILQNLLAEINKALALLRGISTTSQ